jgi:hypothetical protein
MREAEPGQRVMFSSVDLEQRIPDESWGELESFPRFGPRKG